MKLADLIDVELQLLRDREASRETLRERDRRLGLALGADGPRGEDRRALLAAWVAAVQREEKRESVGARLARAHEVLGWLLTVFGLFAGVGSAAAVLAYDGTRPVNVVHFLAVFVALQIVLVTLFLLSSTLWGLRDKIPLLSGAGGLLRLLAEGVARLFERRLTAEQRSTLHAARGRLRATHLIYGDVEHWLLVATAQRFGLWFNLGALASCLYLVAFSDLAFAWQTTLSWSAEGFHKVISILALPWSWVYPDGLPTLDVVRASRYFRLDGTFAGGAASPELLGQWWRFLVLCLLVYGLLPRVVITLLAGRNLKRALAGLRLDHAEIASLLERMSAPLVRTQAPVAERARAAAPAAAPGRAVEVAAGADARVVIWGDVPLDAGEAEALVAGRFGWPVAGLARAGIDDTGQDDAAIAALGAGGRAPVVVVAEAFEAPTREARAFVARLRAAVGPERPVVIALVAEDRGAAPRGDDLDLWQRHLAALGDPYLRVEALV